MVAGPLPAAGVSLVAQNLDQFKAQMREANDAVRNMGREGRTHMQTMRDQITGVISVVGGLTAGVLMLERGYDRLIGRYVAYARQVRETAAATGQEADEVSRLIQLMDDFEIDASTLTMVMRAMRDEGLTPSVETLAQLSDEFLALEPGAARVDFLMDRFGRSGAVFADVMEQGSDAIRERAGAISEDLILSQADLDLTREHELAMDDLNDAIEGASMALAERWIPLLTSAARATQTLLTWYKQIHAVLAQHALDVLDTSEAYEAYRAELIRAAQSAGYYVDAEGDLRGSRGQLIQINYLLTESEYALGRATQESAGQAEAAVSGSIERMSRLDDETLQVRDRMGEVGGAAAAGFGEVNISLANTIEGMRDTAAWIAGGGLQLEQAAADVNARLLAGQITPEEADVFFQPIAAAALNLQEDIGQISMSEATQQMAADWGLTWGDARAAIQGAREDILTLPESVRSQISVDVYWVLHGGAGAGGQHGLNMTVPPGYPNDTFPILASSGERVIVMPQPAGAQSNIYNQQQYDYSQRSIGSVNAGAGENPYEFDRRMRNWMGY